MVVCLSVLALRLTGDLSRVYPALHPEIVALGCSTPECRTSGGRKWMDELFTEKHLKGVHHHSDICLTLQQETLPGIKVT